MKKFLISCGGTGGHLSPGIALAEGLLARGHEARLLISRKKVDARLSEKYPHLRFERMPGTGFGWNPLQLAKCSLSQSQALWFCLRLVRRHPGFFARATRLPFDNTATELNCRDRHLRSATCCGRLNGLTAPPSCGRRAGTSAGRMRLAFTLPFGHPYGL